jgi:putative transcriptional regulator
MADLSAVLGAVRPRLALPEEQPLMKNTLRDLRTGRGWTQEQLGQALGVSRQAVNALETEKHNPSLDLAYRIAALFARPVEEIFENPHG